MQGKAVISKYKMLFLKSPSYKLPKWLTTALRDKHEPHNFWLSKLHCQLNLPPFPCPRMNCARGNHQGLLSRELICPKLYFGKITFTAKCRINRRMKRSEGNYCNS